MTRKADVAIIGGGIVGLATAYRFLERHPGARLVVLEKERELASHQSGRNSGVLHSGIYYKPGTLRAANCREGKAAMEAFCEKEGVPFSRCGKVIVAVTPEEVSRLGGIHERGRANGVECALIGPERLKELEPHAAGLQAIHVPGAGIVNYREVCERLARRIVEAGGTVATSAKVTGMIRRGEHVVVASAADEVEARLVVNCGGLHSDRLARMSGQRPNARIVPFRGEYFELTPSARRLCRGLIYPVPDPAFPFLGVHFTRMIDGGVECGPNAVFAFSREGYDKTSVNPFDMVEALTYPGFLRLARKHWRSGIREMWRSLNKASFVRTLQRLVPEIRSGDLVAAPAGVRAQAVARTGELVDDFLIVEHEQVINVCNAPSPAATSALNIGRLIVDRSAPHLSGARP